MRRPMMIRMSRLWWTMAFGECPLPRQGRESQWMSLLRRHRKSQIAGRGARRGKSSYLKTLGFQIYLQRSRGKAQTPTVSIVVRAGGRPRSYKRQEIHRRRKHLVSSRGTLDKRRSGHLAKSKDIRRCLRRSKMDGPRKTRRTFKNYPNLTSSQTSTSLINAPYSIRSVTKTPQRMRSVS